MSCSFPPLCDFDYAFENVLVQVTVPTPAGRQMASSPFNQPFLEVTTTLVVIVDMSKDARGKVFDAIPDLTPEENLVTE